MNLAVLGAWLHDIGKFAQRAKTGEYSNLAHEYCPQHNGKSTHLHTLYTDYFIENMPLPKELEGSRSLLASFAASHHKAEGKSREHYAIMQADRLSAGMDRTESGNEGNYIADRLTCIFSRVRLGCKGMNKNDPVPCYKLNPVNAPNALFPVLDATVKQDYASLWVQFRQELQNLPLNYGVDLWRDSLISLLEKYCWCIPSATWHTLADVSLYDHSAGTAAIAQAWLACPEGEEKFLLYGGDLSGIQSFIFGEEEPADKGAARLLRARSFLLQAVTRSVWLALLQRLKLESAAKIMDAGGRFMLLLPDTENTRQDIAQFEKDVAKWLLQNFLGAVRLNFAFLPLEIRDFEKKLFSDRFSEFNDRLESAALKPLIKAAGEGLLPVLPIDYNDYARFGECESCHARPGTEYEDEKAICRQCARLKALGRQLPGASFMAFTTIHKTGRDAFLLFDNIQLHLYSELPPESEAKHALQVLSVKGECIFTVAPIAGHIPLITAKDMENWVVDGRLVQKDGENLFMGEPCHPDQPKTFNMLAQASRIPPNQNGESWKSIACLGICKADVDNLGMIFSLGLKDSFSLSCFAMLARMLNQFFAEYLMEMIRREYPDIYVIFAGGDDVFVLGPWPQAIDFAMRMAGDFKKFCGNNPAITISAGLPLLKPGLPMRAIRETSEEALEESKNYPPPKKAVGRHPDNDVKNAVTLFDVTTHWSEAQKLLETGKWLADLCEKGRISNAFLRRLLDYARQCAALANGENMAKNGLYLSHFYYDLSRNWNSRGKIPAIATVINGNCGDKDLIRLINLANDEKLFARAEMGISWAIYRTRKTG